MNWTSKKYIYSLLTGIILLVHSNHSYSQYYLYNNDTPQKLNIEFLKHSIEVKSKQVFFNALKISNKSNQHETFNLNLTVPQGWNIIGNEKVEITVPPLDSILVPVRVAVGTRVRGDIGYSIIASITDSRGNTIKNAYCFIKIPHEFNIQIKFLGGISYLDPSSLSSEFSIQILNSGNREEPINLHFDGKNYLAIESKDNTTASVDVSIPPFSDTVLTYRVKLTEDYFDKKLYPVTAIVKTTYSTTEKNIWFNKLDSKYINHISNIDKPLTIELSAQGLLDAEREPTISATIEGKTYLKGTNDIYYYYRNYASKENSDFYEKTRMYLGAHLGNWNVEVGDNLRSLESPMFGRGGYLAYQNSRNLVQAMANKTISGDFTNYGGSYSFSLNNLSSITAGGAYNYGKNGFESKVGFVGTDLTIKKNHKLNFTFAYNTNSLNDTAQNNELGGRLSYSSRFGKFNTSLSTSYYGINFYTPMAGRFDLTGTIRFDANKKNRIALIYNDHSSKRESTNTETIMGYREGKAEHTYTLSKNASFYWGPALSQYFASGINYFQTGNQYTSLNYKLILGARLKTLNESVLIAPRFEFAKAKITENPFNYNNDKFGYQYFSINIRARYFNIVAFYNSGARTVNDQLGSAYQNQSIRKLQFIPSFDAFIYKDIVKLFVGWSYTNNLSTKLSYSNITGQITCFLPKDWQFRTLAVYSLQKRTTSQDAIETYQTFYAEASIRKEFDLQHPRVKFHDLKFSFFKDFNGNYTQDVNEPGIKNVLVRVEKVKSDVNGRIPSDFFSTDLLSDNLGVVSLENIPEGIYAISYNPIGKEAGSFSKAKDIVELRVDRTGDYFFPFVEKNKVFGKIVLNRSRLSGLGKVDASNIRITATDSRGNTFSTLTDKEGGFIIYAPVTDEYIVNINNIFYEDFDLRQNNFRVQFNGYKQFEVNFVFDEKIRRINFSPSTQDNLADGVLQVRRTNLRGTVKDATTLKPLRARVNLVNTKNNSVVSAIYSNAQTGDYGLSFLADDIYLIEVLADDYWYFSESLNLNQVTTFMNVTKDIMLKQISIGSKMELNIRFAEINKSALGPETVAELNRLLRILKDNSNIKIEIQGHCDDLEAINNPQIGEERAKAVAKYLVENGFSNLQVRGFGNTAPIAPSDSEENRTLNRRVEIEVISK